MMSHSFHATNTTGTTTTSSSAGAESPLSRLRRELLSVRYDDKSKLESEGFLDGNPRVYVSLLQFCIFGFSRPIARLYTEAHYPSGENLTASVFVDAAYRFLQDTVGVAPPFAVSQFLTPGQVERKATYLVDVLRALKHKHNEMYREKIAAGGQSGPGTSSNTGSTMHHAPHHHPTTSSHAFTDSPPPPTHSSSSTSSSNVPATTSTAPNRPVSVPKKPVSSSSFSASNSSSSSHGNGTTTNNSTSQNNTNSASVASRFRAAVGYEPTDMSSTIRSSMVLMPSMAKQAKETNREALNRFESVAVPVDDDDITKGTRVIEVNMQELFTLVMNQMERMEARISNQVSRGLDAVQGRLQQLEGRVKNLEQHRL